MGLFFHATSDPEWNLRLLCHYFWILVHYEFLAHRPLVHWSFAQLCMEMVYPSFLWVSVSDAVRSLM